MATLLPQIVNVDSPSSYSALDSGSSLSLDAKLQAEREKVRRLMYSLRDARFALKTERDARRRFEALYIDLKSKAVDAVPERATQPMADKPSPRALSGRSSYHPLSEAPPSAEKVVEMLESATSLHTEAALSNLLTKAAQRSRDMLGATRCTLYKVNHAAKNLWSIANDIPHDSLPGEQTAVSPVRFVGSSVSIKLPVATGLAGWVATTGQAIRVDDVSTDSRFHPDIDQLEPGFQSKNCICAPIFADGDKEPMAVIQMLNKSGGEAFSEDDEQKLQQVAAHFHPIVRKCALSVNIGKLLDSTKQLLTVGDMEKLLVAIRDRAAQLLECENCCLFMVEETTQSLWTVRKAEGEEHARRVTYERVTLQIGEGLAGYVAATGTPTSFPASELDISADERVGFTINAALCHPIVAPNGNVLAVVLAANKSGSNTGAFYSQDNDLLQSFCRRSSKAIEKCRQFIRLRSLMAGTRELNTEHDMQTLIKSVTARAKELVNAARCTLFLLDNTGSELWSYVTDAEQTSSVDEGGEAVFHIPLGKGIAGTVASTGEPFVAKDAYIDPLFDASFDKATGFRTRAVMCFPILGEAGHVLGAMQMINKNEKDEEAAFFTEEDEDLLQALCSHVAVALTNSRLFEKINVLLKTASSLNSNKDTATLIREMIGHARDLLECERATVFIVDEQRNQLWSQVADGTSGQIRVNIGQGIAGTVAASGKRLQIDDAYNDERFDPATDRATGFRTRNMLCVPMIVAGTDKVIGVTQIINKKGGLSFTSDDLELMSAFSAQACVAFRNNQLFRESAERLAHLAAVLQSLQVLVIAFDRRGYLVSVNRPDEMERYFAVTEEAAKGQTYEQWLHSYPELVSDLRTGLDKSFTGIIEDRTLELGAQGSITYKVVALSYPPAGASPLSPRRGDLELRSRGNGVVLVFK